MSSKPSSKSATGRVRVQSSDLFIGTNVHAPSFLPKPWNSDQGKAEALAGFLKTGSSALGALSVRQWEKAGLKGTKASIEGRELTPDELKSDGFMAGYQRTTTERDLIDMEMDAIAAYQTSKPEELAANMQKIWDDRYKELDPESDVEIRQFRQAKEGWEKITARIAKLEQADTIVALKADQLDDFSIIARHEYENTDQINWQALNDKMLGAGVNPQLVNDFIAATARDIGERAGDTSVIDSLPDRWNSSAPSPKNISKYQDGLRNSRRSAENQGIYDANKRDAAGDKIHDKWEDEQETTAMVNILTGKTEKNAMLDLLKLNFDPAKIRTLMRFEEAYQGSLNSGAEVNHDRVAVIQGLILNADYTKANLNADIKSTALGSGEELAANIVRISQQMRAVASGTRSSNDFTSVKTTLTAYYTADAYTERNMPEVKQYRTKVLREWLRLQSPRQEVDGPTGNMVQREGMSPEEAEAKVLELFPQKDFNSTTATTVEQTIIGYSREDSSFTADDVMAKKPPNMTNDAYLQTLLEIIKDERVIERLRGEL